jgi:hypothetical protein
LSLLLILIMILVRRGKESSLDDEE